MQMLNEYNSLVMIIDIQDKLLNAVYNKTTLNSKAKIMTSASSILGIPIIVTEQYPNGLGNTVATIKSVLPEETMYFEKTSFSAIENQGIANAIKQSEKKQIIIFGIETHICVSQTACTLVAQGYDVTVIKDACGSRMEAEHLAGLQRMKDNNVHIITTEIALFEWLKSAKHPKFKEIQNLIK